MSDIKISLGSSGTGGRISIVRVDGVVDTITAPELEKVMNTLLEQRKFNIIIDLGGVDYISSAGWGIFISNIREIRQNSGDIKLARMIPNVYEIFELLEFDTILRAFDSLEKAKSDFQGPDTASNVNADDESDNQPSPSSDSDFDGPAPSIDLEKAIPIKTATVEKEKTTPDVKQPSPPSNLSKVVVEMVIKDPFFSISEIKREVARKHPSLKPSWWGIWSVLRKNNLLSKKSRFRKARIKTGQGND